MTKHIHADLIHAWADGAEIQFKTDDGKWIGVSPTWNPDYEYRIKPSKVKKEGWVNIYKTSCRRITGAEIWDSRAEAEGHARIGHIVTVKLEWEEE